MQITDDTKFVRVNDDICNVFYGSPYKGQIVQVGKSPDGCSGDGYSLTERAKDEPMAFIRTKDTTPVDTMRVRITREPSGTASWYRRYQGEIFTVCTKLRTTHPYNGFFNVVDSVWVIHPNDCEIYNPESTTEANTTNTNQEEAPMISRNNEYDQGRAAQQHGCHIELARDDEYILFTNEEGTRFIAGCRDFKSKEEALNHWDSRKPGNCSEHTYARACNFHRAINRYTPQIKSVDDLTQEIERLTALKAEKVKAEEEKAAALNENGRFKPRDGETYWALTLQNNQLTARQHHNNSQRCTDAHRLLGGTFETKEGANAHKDKLIAIGEINDMIQGANSGWTPSKGDLGRRIKIIRLSDGTLDMESIGIDPSVPNIGPFLTVKDVDARRSFNHLITPELLAAVVGDNA